MTQEKKAIPEGSYMNKYMFNRFRANKNIIITITGSTGCLSGDTLLKISHNEATRERTIKELWQRFTKNYSHKNKKIYDLKFPSKIRSFDGKIIRLNTIKNVTFSGLKQVYSLELENGLILKVTPEHKILTKNGWKELQSLTKFDEIMCDTPNPESKGRKRIKLRDIGLAVGKNHPYNIQPNGQISVHNLIYEARMNLLEFTEYLDILLNEPEKCKNLKFINPSEHTIHHKDGCHYNNSIENLELLARQEHYQKHNSYTNFSQGIPKYIKIKNLQKLGLEETYDIEMEKPFEDFPFPNFVANGIIVHNSGKSYSALKIAEMWYQYKFQKAFPINNVCFSLEQVARRLKDRNMQKGELLILEEAGANLGAGDFQAKVSKVFTYILQSFRSMNIGLLMTLPVLTMLNKSARQLLHVHMTTEGLTGGKCKLKIKIHQLNQHTGKSYWKAPIIRYQGMSEKMKYVFYSLASKQLRDDYELMKETFVYGLVDNFEENVKTKEQKRADASRQAEEYNIKREAWLSAHVRDKKKNKIVCIKCASGQVDVNTKYVKCRGCGHIEVITI